MPVVRSANDNSINFFTPAGRYTDSDPRGEFRAMVDAIHDAGMEVIYTGLRQTPEMIAESALQEDVDVIALSVLSGAHMTLFPRVLELMKENELDDTLLTGGGIIPEEDMDALAQQGVGQLFGPGTDTRAIVSYIKDWVANEK